MIVRERFGHIYQTEKLLRVVFASLFLLPLVFFGGIIHIVVLALAGVTIYFAALLLLGAIKSQDILKLASAVFSARNQ